MKEVAFKIKLIGDDKIQTQLDAIKKKLQELAKDAEITVNATAGTVSRRTTASGTRTGAGTSPTTTPSGNIPAPGPTELTAWQEYLKLQKELREGLGRTDDEYKALTTRLAELKGELDSTNQEVRNQAAAFRAVKYPLGSMNELAQRLGSLRSAYRNLTEEQRKAGEGKDLLMQIQRTDQEIKKLDGTIGNFQRNVGNYQSAFDGLGKAFGAFQGFAVFGIGAREVIQANYDLSDSMTDVAKTTGLSDEATKRLTQTLGKMNTRTAVNDLLALAEGAGTLNIGGNFLKLAEDAEKAGDKVGAALNFDLEQKEIEKFVSATDKVFSALGKDLPGTASEIATTLGKLAGTLGAEQEKGSVSAGILAIGTVVNELADTTKAKAEPIIDFANRISGITKSARLSAPDVLGLGATIDELGQSSEVAGTVLLKLLPEIGQNVEKFAKIAKKPLNEFRETLARDGNEALLQVLEGAKSTGGGLEELGKITEKFGLEAGRSTQIVGVLGDNLDKVRENQAKAREEFENGTSVIDEFNRKNAGFAAEVDKIKKAFLAAFTNGGVLDVLTAGAKAFGSFVQQAMDAGASTFQALAPVGEVIKTFIVQPLGLAAQAVGGVIVTLLALPKFLIENRDLMVSLGLAILAFNTQAIAGAAAAALLDLQTKRKIITDRIATISQFNLNAAMAANPIGAVILIIAGLIAVIGILARNWDVITAKVQEAWKAFVRIYDSNILLKIALFGIVEPLKAIISLFQNFGAISTKVREVWQNFMRLYEANGMVRAGLAALIEPIKAIISLFQNWGAIWPAITATAKQAFMNLQSGFQQLLTSAQITGLSLQKAFTLPGEVRDQLGKDIDALKKKNEALRDSNIGLGEVFATEYSKAQAAIEAMSKAKATTPASKKTTQAGTPAGSQPGTTPETPTDPEAPAPLEPTAPSEDQIKKAAADRAEALKKIEALSLELLAEGRGKQVAQATSSFSNALEELVGTPEQREQQAGLLTAKLGNEIGDIYKGAREQAIADSDNKFNEALASGLLTTPESIQEAASESEKALRDAYSLLFEEQAAALEQAAAQKISLLPPGSDQAEAIKAGLKSQLEAIKEAQAEAEVLMVDAVVERNGKIIEAQAEAYTQQAEADKLANDRRLADKLAAIEAETVTTEEARAAQAEAIEEAKFEAAIREEEIDAELLQNRIDLLNAAGISTIDLQRQLVAAEISLAEEKSGRLIDLEKKTTEVTQKEVDRRRQAVDITVNAFKNLIGAVGEALQADEKNRKKYGAALKALALGEVALNLVREIQGIRAGAASLSALLGPFAGVIIATQVATAVIQAGISVNKIRKQEFAEGGTISMGEVKQRVTQILNSQGPAQASDAQIIPPQAQSAARSEAITGAGGKGSFGPIKLGEGTQGVLHGPGHAEGGIDMVTMDGRVVSAEGGEYVLQNGNDTYIVNKRATGLHIDSLNDLSRIDPAYFSETKKRLTNQINVSTGGRSLYSAGGTIQVPTPTTANTLREIQNTVIQRTESEDMKQAIEAMNSRMDRMKVVVNPRELAITMLEEFKKIDLKK